MMLFISWRCKKFILILNYAKWSKRTEKRTKWTHISFSININRWKGQNKDQPLWKIDQCCFNFVFSSEFMSCRMSSSLSHDSIRFECYINWKELKEMHVKINLSRKQLNRLVGTRIIRITKQITSNTKTDTRRWARVNNNLDM